jgi:hypothetical protein
MPWTCKLKSSIDINDGRRLATLGDARALILALPALRQADAHWRRTSGLLARAAKGKAVSSGEVNAQLSRSLKAEGLI